MSAGNAPGRDVSELNAGVLDTPHLAAVGSLLTAVNDLGVKLTSALHHVGHGPISSNSDIIVLATLHLDGPQRPNALTKLTGLTSGGTTNLLDRLEGAGLVHRTTEGVDDGRGVRVEPTVPGRRAIEEIGDVFATHVVADPDRLLEMQRRFAAIDLQVPTLPSSLTDVPAQLGDLLRLAEFGRRVSEILATAIDDPTPTKSTLTLWYGTQPGGVRPGQLTELTGLSSAGVSELLERLELRGLVERAAGRPPDRRAVTVTTTAAGERELAVALSVLDEHLPELHAGLVPR